MTEIKDICFCQKFQEPRKDIACFHCAYSVKLGDTWWCAWKGGDAE